MPLKVKTSNKKENHNEINVGNSDNILVEILKEVMSINKTLSEQVVVINHLEKRVSRVEKRLFGE